MSVNIPFDKKKVKKAFKDLGHLGTYKMHLADLVALRDILSYYIAFSLTDEAEKMQKLLDPEESRLFENRVFSDSFTDHFFEGFAKNENLTLQIKLNYDPGTSICGIDFPFD